MQTLLLGVLRTFDRKGRPEPGGSTSTESRISGSFGSLCEQPHLVPPYYPVAHAATAARCRHFEVVRGSRRARRLIQPVAQGLPRPLSRDFDLAGAENLACDPSPTQIPRCMARLERRFGAS